MSDPIVSFDDEPLILVDEHDQVIGHMAKDACHDGDGKLHRAFSVFVFNGQGQLLLQQRSGEKRLWPLVWSNSCCSHPRRGEQTEEAAARRIREELGLATELTYLFKFQYQARWRDLGSENELCSVWIGRSDDAVQVNQNEINAWKFIDPQALEAELELHPDHYTPWLRMEWARMRGDHWPAVEQLWAR